MDANQKKLFNYWQTRTIVVTMIGYALFYFVRKNFSFAMPGLAAEYGISNTSFGIILAVVGLVYGLSRFVNGLIADRMNARYHMSLGLLLCALASFAFGFAPSILGIDIGVAPHTLIILFGVLLVLNNIFQGSGFPPCARLLSHWIPPQELATKMSIWNTSHSIGAGLLAILCGFIMGHMGSDVSGDEQKVADMTYNYVTCNLKDDIKKSDIHIAKVDGIDVEKQGDDVIALVEYTYKENWQQGETVSQRLVFGHDDYTAAKNLIEADPKATPETLARELDMPAAQAKALASIVALSTNAGAWQWCFFLPALIALLGALGIFAFLRDTPKSVGLPELENTKTSIENDDDPAAYKRFVREKVYRNRLIWILAIANFFVYIVRFSVLDWGPKFLTEARDMSYSYAGWTVAIFEIFGIIGMLVAGWATDRFFKGRAHRTCVFCMLGTAVFMTVFYLLPNDVHPLVLICVLAMAGFCIYGPQALIGIAAANQATKKAAATANGLTGIFGYLSVFVSGLGVGMLVDAFGWNYVFLGMIAIAVIGMLVFTLMWSARANGYDEQQA
ncbi:MAG: MFS transporter [Alistipes sp.]|nr:MFS transporter [Alistipes sp.]